MTTAEARLVRVGVGAAALFLAGSSLLTILVFRPLGAADEGAHVAHAYAVSSGQLPKVTDPQSGGPYRYRTDRTLYTAHHPPLFPAVVGPVIRAGNAVGDPTFGIRSARLVSLLFGLTAVVATAGLLREIVPDRPRAWIAGAAFVAATPLVPHISGLVYNDALALAVTTGVSWAGLRILRLGPDRRRIAALAALVTLAGLTRISAVPIAVGAVAVAVVGARRTGSTRRDAARVGAIPLAALGVGAGWFYVRNLVEYGDVSGGDELYDILDRRPRSLGSLIEPAFMRARLDGLWTSREWERGKYGVGPIDSLVELGLAALLVVGLGSLIVTAVRRRRTIDRAVLGFGLWTAVTVLAGFAVHVTSGGTPHSRYLLGMLWLGGLAFAQGAARLDRLHRLAGPALVAGLMIASTIVTLSSTDQVLRNTDLPISAAGDLPTFVADAGSLSQVVLAFAAFAIVLGAVGVATTSARLGRLGASSRGGRAPKTVGPL